MNMAVIDTSMNLPKSCALCKYNSNCEYWEQTVEGYKNKNCPLKTTDDMIAEIKGNFDKHGIVSLYNKGINDTLEVVRRYCDKEQEDGSNN